MASYGKIYEFVRDSQNGAEIIITISKKNYTGESMVRPLGRAPLLKRENNGHIFGTSLEIYAECKVDGEFAQFYTSSADEFLIEVLRDQVLIWSGFISPELYSEPDIAPPYDVQIIATDGLGELKNYAFTTKGVRTIYEHLKGMLDHVKLARSYSLVSDLRYNDGDSLSNPVDLFNVRVDLEHEIGENCYDVLQRLLASINAGMTLFGDKWLIFRETDFIRMAGEEWLNGVYHNGLEAIYRIEDFGSMAKAAWWPIGQMSIVIEPAQKGLILKAPNSYKANALGSAWTLGNAAAYNDAEGAYILPDEGSYIMQSLDFGDDEVGYRLALRVSARNVGQGDEDQAVGIRVKINSHTASGYREYWLMRVESSDRGTGGYAWRAQEDWIEGELAVPMDSDASSDAQDVDIIIPLYDNRLAGIDTRSWIYARSIEVTVFNPSGIHDIHVYGVFLTQYEQTEGYQANVFINNGARESGNEVTFSLTDGSKALPSAYQFMAGLPLLPSANTEIQSWSIGGRTATDYLSAMGEDYAMKVALPRMSYKGKLNVPVRSLPLLFRRDSTLYFPRTYSWDLYNDELEVDLISVPAADITSSSVVVSHIAQAQGSFSSSGSGGGGGIGGGASYLNNLLDVNTEAAIEKSVLYYDGNTWIDKNVATILDEVLQSAKTIAGWFKKDDNGDIYTDVNFYSLKTVASGGKGKEGEGSGSGVVVLEDWGKYDATLPQVLGAALGLELHNRLTAVEKGQADIDLSGYATIDYVTQAIDDLVNGAPAALDTLKEIAEVLQGNVNSIADILTAIETKANKTEVDALKAVDNEIRAVLDEIDADIEALQKKDSEINTSLTGINDKITAIKEITDLFHIDDEGNIYVDESFYSKKTVASGGKGVAGTGGGTGTVMAVSVNGTTYDSVDGIVTIPDYPTKVSQLDNDRSYATTVQLTTDLMSKQDKITASNPLSATLISGLGELAFKSSADLSSDYLPKTGGTITGTGNYPLIIKSGTTEYSTIRFMTSDGNYMNFGYKYLANDTTPSLFFTNKNGWSSEFFLLHSGNYSDYALPLTGGEIKNTDINILTINRGGGGQVSSIAFKGTDTVLFGYLGFDSVNNPIWMDSETNRYSLLHSGNVGEYNAGSADVIAKTYYNENINYARNESKIRLIATGDGGTSVNYPTTYCSGISVLTSYTGWQMVTYGLITKPNPYFRAVGDNGTWSDWKRLAFLDDNVASASSLVTSTKLTFASSSGNNVVFGGDTAPQSYDMFLMARRLRVRVYSDSSSFVDAMYINSSGNVTIGASDLASTTTKLYVDGGIRFAPRTIWGQSFDGTGNVIGNIYLQKNEVAIYGYDSTNSSNVEALYVSSVNKLFLLGYGSAGVGYNTLLYGNNIHLRYGASRVTGFVLNSSGNATIGGSDLATTNYKLYVDGVGAAFGTTNDCRIDFLKAGVNKFRAISTGGYFAWRVNGVDKDVMTINANGNVTIGSSDLAGTDAKLYVDGTIRAKGGISMSEKLYWGEPSWYFIESYSETSGVPPFGRYKFYSGHIFETASGEAMRITNGGNVLIGTTEDNGTKLQVAGSVRAAVAGTSNVSMTVVNNNGTVGLIVGSASRGLYNFVTNRFIVGTDNVNTYLSEGNVGIGTTSPTYKLDVAGQGHFTGAVTIDGTITSKVGIELFAATPYIDFHFGDSTGDYTARIAELESGSLFCYGNWIPNSDNTRSLGASWSRWKNVYGLNGFFPTSLTAGDTTINGNLVVSGDTLHTGWVYFANGTTYYINAGGAARFASLTTGAITASTISASGRITANAGLTIPTGQKLAIGGATLEWDGSALKITGNAYATGTLASGGKGTAGAGNSGALLADWADLPSDTASQKLMSLSAYLGNSLRSELAGKLSTTGNAASATRLAGDTSYTAWGRTFFSNGKPMNITSSPVVNNNGGLYIKDSEGNNRLAVYYASDDVMYLGSGSAQAGDITRVCGRQVLVVAGTNPYGDYTASFTSSGLALSSGKTLTIGDVTLSASGGKLYANGVAIN